MMRLFQIFSRKAKPSAEQPAVEAGPPAPWRTLARPDADTADLLAYPAALIEGRIAGKYMLNQEQIPDTAVLLGFREKGILAGADVDIDRTAADRHDIAVARHPRGGRGGPQPAGAVSLSDLTRGASRRFTPAERDPDSPAVLLYTSGTTGRPKGVTLTHRNFISQCAMVDTLLPLTPEDRLVLVLPLFHVYGLANGLVWGTHAGITMALIPQYSPAKLLKTIEDVNATVLIAIPSMYQHLLRLAKARKTALPQSLRLCVSGGAPLPIGTLREFESVFGARIAEGYGLTETTSAVSLNLSGGAFKPGSIGRAAEGVEMRIVDDAGTTVPDGETGEIVIRGGMVTPGYWNDTEATAHSIYEGWLRTGDIGHRDSEGFFFVTERKKDLFIRGGFNISPREIEEVVRAHPAVEDAAAGAGYDRRGREIVKLYVVPCKGTELTTRELMNHCAANLADYKCPRSIEFRETLPRTATGKVVRRELEGDAEDDRLLDA